MGFEPTTTGATTRCSANWATPTISEFGSRIRRRPERKFYGGTHAELVIKVSLPTSQPTEWAYYQNVRWITSEKNLVLTVLDNYYNHFFWILFQDLPDIHYALSLFLG